MKLTKTKLKEIIREEIQKLDEAEEQLDEMNPVVFNTISRSGGNVSGAVMAY